MRAAHRPVPRGAIHWPLAAAVPQTERGPSVPRPPGGRPSTLIRDDIIRLVERALEAAQAAGDLPQFAGQEVTVEHPARVEHGDFSANLPKTLHRSMEPDGPISN